MTDVYWNLHRDCFSVRLPGRPVIHTDRIVLRNARFVVQRGGWERTIRERVKRVHAMVRGEITEAPQRAPHNAVAVTYNPYRADHFQIRATGQRIDTATAVWFSIEGGKPVVLASNGDNHGAQ